MVEHVEWLHTFFCFIIPAQITSDMDRVGGEEKNPSWVNDTSTCKLWSCFFIYRKKCHKKWSWMKLFLLSFLLEVHEREETIWSRKIAQILSNFLRRKDRPGGVWVGGSYLLKWYSIILMHSDLDTFFQCCSWWFVDEFFQTQKIFLKFLFQFVNVLSLHKKISTV